MKRGYQIMSEWQKRRNELLESWQASISDRLAVWRLLEAIPSMEQANPYFNTTPIKRFAGAFLGQEKLMAAYQGSFTTDPDTNERCFVDELAAINNQLQQTAGAVDDFYNALGEVKLSRDHFSQSEANQAIIRAMRRDM
jgi:hypothetical protein